MLGMLMLCRYGSERGGPWYSDRGYQCLQRAVAATDRKLTEQPTWVIVSGLQLIEMNWSVEKRFEEGSLERRQREMQVHCDGYVYTPCIFSTNPAALTVDKAAAKLAAAEAAEPQHAEGAQTKSGAATTMDANSCR